MTQKLSDKSKLLNKLTIDRSQVSDPVATSMSKTLTIAISSALVGGLISYYFFDSNNIKTSLDEENSLIKNTYQIDEQANKNTLNKTSSLTKKLYTKETLTRVVILNASGYITARRMATVSSQVMGLIEEVNVEEGMAVKKDQILAQLDDTKAQIYLLQSKARVESLMIQRKSSKATLSEAKRQYKRVMDNQYSSEADKTRAATNKKLAVEGVNQINAEIKIAKIGVSSQQELLNNHTIRAPFDGVVTMKNAQPGEIVAPSSAGGGFTRTGICTIVDMNSLEIEVDVNESYIGRVYAGQQVDAHLDAYPDWTIPASVIAIIPTADRGKATVSVRIRIEIKDKKILPEMGVKVAFLQSEEQEST